MKTKKQINSYLVGRNFSKSSGGYSNVAEFQRESSQKIAELIFKHTSSDRVKQVLEIGCGTGFLSEKLLSKFSQSDFLITDISKHMLEVCRRTIKPHENQKVLFQENDITQEVPGGEYDLVVSALTFQWVPNLAEVFEKIKRTLKPGGYFVFSTLLNGTFSKLKLSFNIAGAVFPGPMLMTMDELLELIVGWDDVESCFDAYREDFSSVIEFLKHVKSTGAVNASGMPVSATVMRNVVKIYNDEFSSPDGSVEAEYDVIYCVLRKPLLEEEL